MKRCPVCNEELVVRIDGYYDCPSFKDVNNDHSFWSPINFPNQFYIEVSKVGFVSYEDGEYTASDFISKFQIPSFTIDTIEKMTEKLWMIFVFN